MPSRRPPGVQQHGQVARNRWLWQLENVHHLVDVQLGAVEGAQNAQPRRVGESFEDVG
jgi:hypothetical protein